MLSLSLHRAQLELQSHRLWLRRFASGVRFLSSPPSAGAHPLAHHGITRQIGTQNALQTSTRASFSTKKVKSRKRAKSANIQSPVQRYDLLPGLQQAVQEVDVETIAALYRGQEDKSAITPQHFRAIAQCLHHAFRVRNRELDPKLRRVLTEDLLALAEEIIKDVVKGNLAPHKLAHIHLIGLFKESTQKEAGVRFWQWLEGQDESYVGADVYGAGIEILAINGAPLSTLEELYQQALSRFPGNFNSYHLSPDAIVPDRNQPTTLKGVPTVLLQGILTARLIRGDVRAAYLALDVAFRLYPDQVPPRFLQLFVEERPLLEAYAVFAMACRGGIAVSSTQFRQHIAVMRTSSDLSSVVRHSLAVRAMLSSIYLYLGAGGKAYPNTLNELLITITQFMRLRGISKLNAKSKQTIVGQITDLIKATISAFARYGLVPGISAFNSIITNLGGFGHSKQIIGVALSDAEALGSKPNEITRRSVLTAAGLLEDKDFVKKAWKDLIQGRRDAGQTPDATDLYVLIKNAHLTDQVAFALEAFEEWKDRLPEDSHYGLLAALETVKETEPNERSKSFDTNALLAELSKIRKDVDLIDQRVAAQPGVQDFSEQSLPMTLLRPDNSTPILPEDQLRKLYDELTTEQRPSLPMDAASKSENMHTSLSPTHAVTATNMPFGKLRYENWKSINYLLAQAEIGDRAYRKVVDEAIVAGAAPPPRAGKLGLDASTKLESYGLSDAEDLTRETIHSSNAMDESHVIHARNEILRLRGRIVG